MRSATVAGLAGLLFAATASLGCAPGRDRVEAVQLPAPPAGQRPDGLYATWLGTAGVVIDDGETRLVIDPFVTRDRLGHVLFRRPVESDPALVDHWLSRAGGFDVDAVFVTHSHYDHTLDAPMVALRTGAVLVGSPDTLLQGRAHRLESRQLVPAETGVPMHFGRFTVTLRPSEHGTPDLYPGHADKDFRVPARARDYRTGEVYVIVIEHPYGTLMHQGSAAWTDETYDESTRADVVLLGVAARDDTTEYIEGVVDRVGAKTIIPIHFDNFFRRLDRPWRPLFGVKLPEFFRVVDERPDLEVQTLPIGEPRQVVAAPTG
ncbi:MAG: MBL fold metallo-hydrolase [Myxococcota bacterium]